MGKDNEKFLVCPLNYRIQNKNTNFAALSEIGFGGGDGLVENLKKTVAQKQYKK